jgi:hypothetical protein
MGDGIKPFEIREDEIMAIARTNKSMAMIEGLLRSGKAWIEGQLDEEPHNTWWIITNSEDQSTWHVSVYDRPGWKTFLHR